MAENLNEIKTRRKAMGLSQTVFAMNAGVSVCTLSKIEHDGYDDLTLRTVRKIFSALDRLEKQGVRQNQ